MTARGRSATRWIAIAATFVNLGIHLSMAPDHLAEMPYIGILFVIGSALLGAIMIGLASDRDGLRTLAWAGGVLVCAVESILFVLSRTTGLPQGYHEAWAAAPEDLLGLASLAVELLFIGCAAYSLTPSGGWGRPNSSGRLVLPGPSRAWEQAPAKSFGCSSSSAGTC